MRQWERLAVAGLCCVLFGLSLTALGKNKDTEFNHFKTGYPLTGAHEFLDCQQCHADGIFSGTTRQCHLCHNNVLASGKPIRHLITIEACDECHATSIWDNIVPTAILASPGAGGTNIPGSPGRSSGRFIHPDVNANCRRCHNGSQAPKKPTSHITTSNICESCHRSNLRWTPVNPVDHAEVLGRCANCHNRTIAKGKPTTHLNSGNTCGDCHSNVAFKPVLRVEHNSVIGTCNSCHNGSTGQNKPAAHINSTTLCADCHITTAWKPVSRVNHDSVIGTCINCHRKLTLHVNSNNLCADCHSTTAWKPVIAFNHDAVVGSCGASNCHATKFNFLFHVQAQTVNLQGVTTTTAYYTLNDLLDCTGACHITVSTLTTGRGGGMGGGNVTTTVTTVTRTNQHNTLTW